MKHIVTALAASLAVVLGAGAAGPKAAPKVKGLKCTLEQRAELIAVQTEQEKVWEQMEKIRHQVEDIEGQIKQMGEMEEFSPEEKTQQIAPLKKKIEDLKAGREALEPKLKQLGDKVLQYKELCGLP
jgi:peptidoglycan hydrolase CwlO-like protein